MPRDLDSAFEAAILQPVVRPVFLVEITFESGTIYAWSGLGSIDWNGQTWLGVGDIGSISPISETADLRAQGVVVTLTGIPSSLLGSVLGDVRQGLPATVWLGAMTPDGQLDGEPAAAYPGRVDVPSILDSRETIACSIAIENELIDMRTPKLRRWSNEDQIRDEPTDKGFEFTTKILKDDVIHFGGETFIDYVALRYHLSPDGLQGYLNQ